METTTITKTFPLWALVSLSSAYFMVGTSSLSVIALTWQISDGLQVPPSDIAFLVTVFALAFAIAAPLTQVLFSGYARIKILCTGLGLLALALILGASSTSYEMLFVSRGLMGLSAAAISPMCSAIGAGLAPPEQQGRAMGIVFAGLTFASVLGTPISAYLGTLMSWRLVHLLLALVALSSMASILYFVKDRQAGAPISFSHLVEAMTRIRSSFTVLTTFLQMTAIFCTYALIAPFMSHKFGLPENLIALVLLAYGVNGVLGNVFAGRLSDRFGPEKVIFVTLAGLGAGFFMIWAIGPNLWLAFIAIVIWSAFGMMFHSPQQQRIANIDPERRSLLLALNAAALYLGISVGSWISNFVSVRWGYEVLPLVSLVVLSACAVIFSTSVFAMGRGKNAAGGPD
ncbi:MFS transporter [Sneathiella sp. CAU 1612]|uniref:MFS transporter n=1 Tax=Sneathiella sedimenti TaxID=2816034 RepID=A0ABS3F4S5_9PROT|nr:MFS transporter [Sneathiella sedimenti]MBO0333528.1 MFS transporter [Sneathiella sedimenti]